MVFSSLLLTDLPYHTHRSRVPHEGQGFVVHATAALQVGQEYFLGFIGTFPHGKAPKWIKP